MRRVAERHAVERRVSALRARVAERVRALLPDAKVEQVDAGVAVNARRLVRRWIDDPRLSWWRE